MFWPLMAGFTPPDRLAEMVKELQNPNSFGRRNGVPSLSADSQGYNKETGAYWRGSVWPSAQCMVQEGLKETGQWPVLNTLATKYFNACLEAYDKQKDVTEYISPDSNPAVGHGAGEFVGWGGIGPVANLIEYILGLEINAPEKVIVWRIRRTDRHGIENLTLNNITATLICAARQTADAECHITITNSGPFTLRVQNGNGPIVEKKIVAGTQQIAIPATIKQQE
jgi:glycogen debranching enzyme